MGRASQDQWEKDGVKRYRTFVRVERFEFCGKSRAATTDTPAIETQTEVSQETPTTPF